MSAFDWLEPLATPVRRKKFFQFHPQPLSCLDEIEEKYGPLPQPYKEFAARYGGAELFRHDKLQLYLVEVLAPPQVSRPPGKPAIIELGHYIDTGYACLKWQDGGCLGSGAIYTGTYRPTRRFKGSFEEWLKTSCAKARKLYTKGEWEALLRPVEPFTPEEARLVGAIPLFSFRKVGVTEAGTVLIEVENNSAIELPRLTVGVRLGPPHTTGGCTLPTAGIKPGATATLECAIYQGSADPERIELFRLPLPEPEDRPYYYEFATDMIWNTAAKKWVRSREPSGSTTG